MTDDDAPTPRGDPSGGWAVLPVLRPSVVADLSTTVRRDALEHVMPTWRDPSMTTPGGTGSVLHGPPATQVARLDGVVTDVMAPVAAEPTPAAEPPPSGGARAWVQRSLRRAGRVRQRGGAQSGADTPRLPAPPSPGGTDQTGGWPGPALLPAALAAFPSAPVSPAAPEVVGPPTGRSGDAAAGGTTPSAASPPSPWPVQRSAVPGVRLTPPAAPAEAPLLRAPAPDLPERVLPVVARPVPVGGPGPTGTGFMPGAGAGPTVGTAPGAGPRTAPDTAPPPASNTAPALPVAQRAPEPEVAPPALPVVQRAADAVPPHPGLDDGGSVEGTPVADAEPRAAEPPAVEAPAVETPVRMLPAEPVPVPPVAVQPVSSGGPDLGARKAARVAVPPRLAARASTPDPTAPEPANGWPGLSSVAPTGAPADLPVAGTVQRGAGSGAGAPEPGTAPGPAASRALAPNVPRVQRVADFGAADTPGPGVHPASRPAPGARLPVVSRTAAVNDVDPGTPRPTEAAFVVGDVPLGSRSAPGPAGTGPAGTAALALPAAPMTVQRRTPGAPTAPPATGAPVVTQGAVPLPPPAPAHLAPPAQRASPAPGTTSGPGATRGPGAAPVAQRAVGLPLGAPPPPVVPVVVAPAGPGPAGPGDPTAVPGSLPAGAVARPPAAEPPLPPAPGPSGVGAPVPARVQRAVRGFGPPVEPGTRPAGASAAAAPPGGPDAHTAGPDAPRQLRVVGVGPVLQRRVEAPGVPSRPAAAAAGPGPAVAGRQPGVDGPADEPRPSGVWGGPLPVAPALRETTVAIPPYSVQRVVDDGAPPGPVTDRPALGDPGTPAEAAPAPSGGAPREAAGPPADAAALVAPGALPRQSVEELANRLYEPIMRRLRAELRFDRERSGWGSDPGRG